MKKVIQSGLYSLLVIGIGSVGYSQDMGVLDEENYVKKNVALTKFKILGVNAKAYAKCIESQNFAETSRQIRYTELEKVEFVDNGEDYDLVANDGIMTSKTLFGYEGQPVLSPGEYKEVRTNVGIHDPQFEHVQKLSTQEGKIKVLFTCGFYWKPCSAWPPAAQNICRRLSWPFSGGLVVHNCSVEVGWD